MTRVLSFRDWFINRRDVTRQGVWNDTKRKGEENREQTTFREQEDRKVLASDEKLFYAVRHTEAGRRKKDSKGSMTYC